MTIEDPEPTVEELAQLGYTVKTIHWGFWAFWGVASALFLFGVAVGFALAGH